MLFASKSVLANNNTIMPSSSKLLCFEPQTFETLYFKLMLQMADGF